MQQMLITEGLGREDLFEKLKSGCEGGIDAIQIREKTMEGDKLFDLASRLLPIAIAHHVTLLINDRIDIAIACGLTGVHLPERGLSPRIAKQLQPSLLVGCSVHSLERALQKEAEGADYLLFGPVFTTSSKPGLIPKGLESLRIVASSVRIPVMALGGVTVSKIASCIEAGAKGIAGISCYWNSPTIETGIFTYAKALSDSQHPSRSFT
jgi:thiamine-phosphate pyrophosphorylase